MEHFDLIVIGGGPGGYPLALATAKGGLKTAVVTLNNDFGGTCVNRGCIPTKALLTSVYHLNALKNCASFGLECSSVKADRAKIFERKNQITAKMNGDVERLLKKNNITIFNGLGRLFKNKSVEITGPNGEKTKITADKICLAVGSIPAVPRVFPADRNVFLTSDEALDLQSIPESLLIVGGGVMGLELGQVFLGLGSKVTIVEMLPQILNGLDTAVANRLLPVFKKTGLEIITKTPAASPAIKNGKASVVINGEERIFEKALVCAGRRVNYAFEENTDLALERDGAFIKINENFETSESGVYAIGDAVKGPMLAHKASYEAKVLSLKLLGTYKDQGRVYIPACVFTHPEISWVGESENTLKEKGVAYKTGKALYSANGRAVAMGQADGQIKVMISEEGKLLGAVMWGPSACELIAGAAVIMRYGIDCRDFSSVIYAHPTLSEVFAEAMQNAVGQGS